MSLMTGLILLAFVFFFFEIFVPGGILAIVGGVCLLAAAFIAWGDLGPYWAIGILVGGTLAGFALFFIEIRFITRSPFGRQLRLEQAITAQVRSTEDASLAGKSGVALTSLAPSGKVRVENRIYTAAAADGFIERGAAISVKAVSPFKIIVTKS